VPVEAAAAVPPSDASWEVTTAVGSLDAGHLTGTLDAGHLTDAVGVGGIAGVSEGAAAHNTTAAVSLDRGSPSESTKAASCWTCSGVSSL
jgi:hypothetical protein